MIHSLPFRRIPFHRSGYFSSSSRASTEDSNGSPLGRNNPLPPSPCRSGSCKAFALLPRAIGKAILCGYLRDGARHLSYRIYSNRRAVLFELFIHDAHGGNALPPCVKAPFLKSRRSENAAGEMIGIYWLYNLNARPRAPYPFIFRLSARSIIAKYIRIHIRAICRVRFVERSDVRRK